MARGTKAYRKSSRWRWPALLATLLVIPAVIATNPTPPVEAAGTVLFGASPGSGGAARQGALTDLESQLGRELDLVRVFELWDSPFPTAYHDALAASDRTMLLSVRARQLDGTFMSWRDIADAPVGSPLHDDMVAWVESVRDVGELVYFTFNHEPEIVAHQPSGVDQDFIDAWQRFIDEFRARDVTNVEFVWIMTDYSFHAAPSDRRHAPRWYPGDEYVDHIAMDAYNWHECRTTYNSPWQTLAEIIEPMRVFGQDHPSKGLMLTEWASPEFPGDNGAMKAGWVRDTAALFKQPGYEQFVAVSYFNHQGQPPTGHPCDFPVDSTQASLDAFIEMADDPFYGGSGTGPPPPPPPPEPEVILSSTADASGSAGRQWQSVIYTAEVDGTHTFEVGWTGGGTLWMDVRIASNGSWLAANTSSANPKSVAPLLTAGVAYRIAVWARVGIGVFDLSAFPPVPADAPPNVSVTAPSDGDTVVGPVVLTAQASDDIGVTQVEFLADGITLGVDIDGADGWSLEWDSTFTPDGSVGISAIATDTSSQSAADAIVVEVDNIDEPPTATLLGPADGALVSGQVDLTAVGSDDDAVTQVEFLADGFTVGVDADGSNGWSTAWDSSGTADGEVVLEAIATDTAGQTGSDAFTVAVDNAGPTVAITNPVDSETVSGIVPVIVSAGDQNGVASVELFVNGAALGTDTDGSDGWALGWNTTTAPNGTSPTISVTATDNAGNTATDLIVVSVDNSAVDAPPVVAWEQPAEGSTVTGSTVLLMASATDDLGVSQVAFSAAGELVGVDTDGSDGWSAVWDTTSASNGPTAVEAVAADTIGQTASSGATLVVDNGVAAAIILTGTADDAGVAGRRWQSTLFQAAEAGAYTFDLDWTGSGLMKMDLRVASSGAWIAADVSTNQPKSMTVALQAGVVYRVAAWAFTGSADFTLTVSPPA